MTFLGDGLNKHTKDTLNGGLTSGKVKHPHSYSRYVGWMAWDLGGSSLSLIWGKSPQPQTLKAPTSFDGGDSSNPRPPIRPD